MENNSGKRRIALWAVVFWLLVWEIISRLIGWDIILVSPVRVIWKLFELVREKVFWQSVALSFFRIMGGYVLALVAGTLFAALSSQNRIIRELLQPAMLVIRAVPVASFIVLALILFSSRTLSTLISFLMATPVIYAGVLNGIAETDRELLEAADVNGANRLQKARFVYAPSMWSSFSSTCRTAMGLAWKAGIAAEVIGIPQHTIGAHLRDAKTYLDTPALFAWTLTIVLLSFLSDRLFVFLANRISRLLR